MVRKRGSGKIWFLIWGPKILAQIAIQETQEYFVYFKFSELISCVKRLDIQAKNRSHRCPPIK